MKNNNMIWIIGVIIIAIFLFTQDGFKKEGISTPAYPSLSECQSHYNSNNALCKKPCILITQEMADCSPKPYDEAGQYTYTYSNDACDVWETFTMNICYYGNGGSCTPSCSGKECGSDGCGGSCGSCGSGMTCYQDAECISSTNNNQQTYIDANSDGCVSKSEVLNAISAWLESSGC